MFVTSDDYLVDKNALFAAKYANNQIIIGAKYDLFTGFRILDHVCFALIKRENCIALANQVDNTCRESSP